MPFKQGLELILTGFKKDAEDRLWEQYCHLYPCMVKGEISFISFAEFKRRNLPDYAPKKKEEKSVEELVAWAEEIKRKDRRGSVRGRG